jgi:hypothetical protein
VRFDIKKTMKYLFISGLCLFFSFSVQCQDLKKIKKKNCNRNVSEVYQVRRDSEAIKEGFIKNSIKRLYEHKKAYNYKCEEKAMTEKVTFRLE